MAGLIKPDAHKLPEKIARVLAGEIAQGRFVTGKPLPPESELAERFGVSRTVIREALARLKYDGLVESRPRVGAIVVPAGQRRAFRLDSLDPRSGQDLRDLYELRALVESGAAALAAVRHTARDIERMERHLASIDQALENGRLGASPDLAFHRDLASASRNPVLDDFMRFLNTKVSAMIRMARKKSNQDPELAAMVQDEHRAILEAVASGDSERARRAVLSHMQKGALRQGLQIVIPGGPRDQGRHLEP
ncbi:MAG: FadR family transcriptional regulator [Desulfarculus sp.]|nr:FadR family transcriptional regulator [Desulfarculus sp.]